jgi:hypothetical protein
MSDGSGSKLWIRKEATGTLGIKRLISNWRSDGWCKLWIREQ